MSADLATDRGPLMGYGAQALALANATPAQDVPGVARRLHNSIDAAGVAPPCH
jgi:hypothetical protein